MILSAILFLGLQGDLYADEVKFQTSLATSARGELNLIDRLRALRTATEKLPSTWKSSSFKTAEGENKVLTKQGLLDEIQAMEYTAAERWAIILENTATVDVNVGKLETRALAMRKKIEDLPNLHLELNTKLDAFNKRLKDGILLNLATRLSN